LKSRLKTYLVATMTALLLLVTGIAWAADTIFPDGDSADPSPNLAYSSNAGDRDCNTRGTAVDGEIKVNFNGASDSNHFTAGEAVDVTLTPAAGSNIFATTSGTVPDVPATWGATQSDTFSIPISTTVPAALGDGTYGVEVTVTGRDSGYAAGWSEGSGKPKYNVIVNCGTTTPTNEAPNITSAAFNASSIDCRQQLTLTVNFTDPDSSSWSADIDWDYTAPTFDVDETKASVTSPFSATHTYNSPGTYTAGVRVTDNQGATSAVKTASVTITQEYTVSFLPPFDPTTSGAAVINKAKAGRVVPVKEQIFDVCANQSYTGTSAAPSVNVTKTSNPASSEGDPVESYADAGLSNGNDKYFRWSTDGFWIYNLDTKALQLVTGNTYRIDVFVGSVKATDDEWGLLATVK
jgi:hypothetical protein